MKIKKFIRKQIESLTKLIKVPNIPLSKELWAVRKIKIAANLWMCHASAKIECKLGKWITVLNEIFNLFKGLVSNALKANVIRPLIACFSTFYSLLDRMTCIFQYSKPAPSETKLIKHQLLLWMHPLFW